MNIMNMKPGDRITLDELKRLVEIEVGWLGLYGREDTRMKLDINSSIYDDLVSIGWTKKVMKLELRCCPCIITSDETITENFDITKLKIAHTVRGENKYTPVETYIKIYPDEKMDIINRIKKI